MSKNVAKVIAFAVLVLAFAFYLHGNAKPVKASFPHNVTGQAWSTNIGWISFSCDNTNTCGSVDYGVDIDVTNAITGFAWSNEIGWVNFNANNCPVPDVLHGCASWYEPLTGNIKGWARACAGTANGDCASSARTDGWDGWIKLSGTAANGNPYGAKFTLVTGQGGGQAWGSDVVGWIDFSQVKYGQYDACPNLPGLQPTVPAGYMISGGNCVPLPPAIDLTVTYNSMTSNGPITVPSGTSVVLTWTPSNMALNGITSCSTTNGNTGWPSGSRPTSGSITTSAVTSSVTFNITCGTATDNVTVNVTPPGTPIVNTVSGYANTTTSASLNGSFDPNGSANVPVLLYFRYGTDPTLTTHSFASATPSSSSAVTNFSLSLTSLAQSTTYYYQAIAQHPTTSLPSAVLLAKLSVPAATTTYTGTIKSFTTGAAPIPSIDLQAACWQNYGYIIFNSVQNMGAGESCAGSAPWTAVPGTLPAASTILPSGTYSLTCTDSSNGPASDSVTISTPCVGPPGPIPPKPKAKPKFEEF